MTRDQVDAALRESIGAGLDDLRGANGYGMSDGGVTLEVRLYDRVAKVRLTEEQWGWLGRHRSHPS